MHAPRRLYLTHKVVIEFSFVRMLVEMSLSSINGYYHSTSKAMKSIIDEHKTQNF